MNVAVPASPHVLTTRGYVTALERITYLSLCAFLISMPWEEAPQLKGFILARWLGVATLGIAALHLSVSGRRRSLSGVHYLMAGFVAFSSVSILWSLDGERTLTYIGTYCQLLVIAWLIWEFAAREVLVLGLMQAYSVGILIAALLTLYNFANGTTAVQLQAARGVQGWEESRYSIMGVNENDLGLMLALALPLMIYLVIRTDRSWMRAFLWSEFVVCIAAILLTGSRGALISAGIALAMLPMSFKFLPASQRIAAALACAGAVASSILFIPLSTWTRLLMLDTELTQGTLTHRTLIWSAGLGAFREHPFLGVGSGAHATAVLHIVNVPYVAHNTFMSVLVELGVAGALVFLALLASLCYTAFRLRNLERRLWFTVLVTWTVGVMALTWEYRKPTWIMFGLLPAHAYSRRDKSFTRHL